MKSFLITAIFLSAIGITFAEYGGRAFKLYGLVPDIIDKIPDSLAEICYPGNVRVQTAKELTPEQIKEQPKVTWRADCYSFYTIFMLDPDAPSRAEPIYRAVEHWFVGNIPGTNVAEGDVFAAYQGPLPANDTGLHRYTFLIYKQPGRINFTEKRLSNTNFVTRRNFSINQFVAKYNLGDPVAGNFFQAQFDESVTARRALLGCQVCFNGKKYDARNITSVRPNVSFIIE